MQFAEDPFRRERCEVSSRALAQCAKTPTEISELRSLVLPLDECLLCTSASRSCRAAMQQAETSEPATCNGSTYARHLYRSMVFHKKRALLQFARRSKGQIWHEHGTVMAHARRRRRNCRDPAAPLQRRNSAAQRFCRKKATRRHRVAQKVATARRSFFPVSVSKRRLRMSCSSAFEEVVPKANVKASTYLLAMIVSCTESCALA